MIDAELAAPARGARFLIAVGAGRGGVGKSLLAASLATYFAQLGKRVVLADADAGAGNVHSLFGLRAADREPPLEREAQEAFAAELVPTLVPGLSLLPAAHDAPTAPTLHRTGRKARWLARLRALPADYVIVDAGSGHAPFVLDVLAAADAAIAVTTPEPPAIEAVYRFLRASFLRRLRRAVHRDKFRSSLVARALGEIGGLPAPIEILRTLHKMDRTLAESAWLEARRFSPLLVVNQTRVRSDLDVPPWMCALADRHLGVPLEELGHVEHDDSVWLAVRRSRPLLIDSPTSKAARNVERLARRLAAWLTTPESRSAPPQPLRIEAPTLYEALGVARGASDEDVRRAHKRQRDLYAPGSLALASLLSDPARNAELARADEAHDTLLDPVRRRAYDLSTFPDADDGRANARAPRPALAAEQILLQAELARTIGPDTEFSGELLRRVRESQGIELTEIASFTKISRGHLQAIEDEHAQALPAHVYVRGFLTEIAKFLKLDPSQVQRTYLRRLREQGALERE